MGDLDSSKTVRSRNWSATVTVTVTVHIGTEAPVSGAISQSDGSRLTGEYRETVWGAAVTIQVLANDSDANGDTLTITSVSAPQLGTASTNGQAVTYTPNANFTGVDSFSYIVSDGKGGETAGFATVTVGGAQGANAVYLPLIRR